MENSSSFKIKIQKFGATLSAMVMPNIPAFIAWGILTALFIPTGWAPNEDLNNLVGPTLKFLMPILIGYTGGYNVYGKRGGVAGAIATIGVVIGAEITMLIGGMVMGPLGAIIIKYVDKALEGHIKTGLEMLVNNFTLGIIGALIMVAGYWVVTPIFDAILSVISSGVQWTVDNNLLPFASIFVPPAQVLFLNNAVNHGIMIPLGVEQAAETGKSILFLVEANGGMWSGLVLAYCIFAKGEDKSSAYSALPIMVFGGIGEVAFPYALMHPSTLLGPIVGNTFAIFVLQMFDGGTVAAVSPGSIIALVLMSPKDSMFINVIAYLGAAAISCVIAGFFLMRIYKNTKPELEMAGAGAVSGGSASSITATGTVTKLSDFRMMNEIPKNVKKIVVACDAGMGSSTMGTSLLKSKVSKAMLNVEVKHNSVAEIDADADVVITSDPLFDRAVSSCPNKNAAIIGFDNLMNKDGYDMVINEIKKNV
ncbi:PTS transporter subunit EIIC [Amedibacillus sp. YH-ame6]